MTDYNDANSQYQESETIYRRLATHLDNLPAGFPATDSGVEIRLLKKLFSEEEAALALHLTLIPENAEVIAYRCGIENEVVARRLTEMARKGLIYSIEKDGKPPLYSANQLVIGIWEYHVQDLDRELIEYMNQYIPHLLKEAWKLPQLRTIPVEKSLTPKLEVMTYEIADKLLDDHKRFAVAPCICRREKKIMGEGCDGPEESCLVFDTGADYYVRNGMGRYISKDDAREILQRSDDAGLVLQPGNARRASNICCCCGCCCGVLRTLKQYPNPAEMVSSPFYVQVDDVLCEGCGICRERCQLDALEISDDTALVKLQRCIGCGLCVTTCPNDAIQLMRKLSAEQVAVARNNREAYIKLGQKRGKLGPIKIIQMLFKSKYDRFMAQRRL